MAEIDQRKFSSKSIPIHSLNNIVFSVRHYVLTNHVFNIYSIKEKKYEKRIHLSNFYFFMNIV